MHRFLLALGFGGVIALMVATLLGDRLGRAGFPLPPNDRRVGCIDGLRGYLAMSVMVHHFFIWIDVTRLGGSWGVPPIHFLNQLGAGGVALFFMTTGLVFYPRILKGFGSTSWSTVYVARVFRILPLVAFSVGLVTAIIVARTGATLDANYLASAAQWIGTWAQVPILGYADSGRINAYVLWSLWYEWLFYLLLLPVCAMLMDIVRSRAMPSWTVPAGLFVTAIGARGVGRLLHQPLDVLQYLPLFAVGMLAFECQSRLKVRTILSRPQIAVVAVVALVVGMETTENPYTLSLPLFGFFFVCVACGNSLGGLLLTRGALVLGECSFGIYLLHGILLDLLFVDAHAVHDQLGIATLPVMLPAVAAAVVSVSSLTYLLIERPMMRAGRSSATWLAGYRARLGTREIEVAP